MTWHQRQSQEAASWGDLKSEGASGRTKVAGLCFSMCGDIKEGQTACTEDSEKKGRPQAQVAGCSEQVAPMLQGRIW